MAKTKHDEGIAADKTSAQAAVDRADAQELFTIFERMVKRYADLEMAFDSIVGHYIGAKDAPRFQPPSDAIKAMESVALAAIDLARAVAASSAAGAGDPS